MVAPSLHQDNLFTRGQKGLVENSRLLQIRLKFNFLLHWICNTINSIKRQRKGEVGENICIFKQTRSLFLILSLSQNKKPNHTNKQTKSYFPGHCVARIPPFLQEVTLCMTMTLSRTNAPVIIKTSNSTESQNPQFPKLRPCSLIFKISLMAATDLYSWIIDGIFKFYLCFLQKYQQYKDLNILKYYIN